MNTGQGCHNCVHRHGRAREYWKCSRTGYHTSTEMKFGGRCAHGQELRLWAPRPTLLGRVISIVRRDTPTAQGAVGL